MHILAFTISSCLRGSRATLGEQIPTLKYWAMQCSFVLVKCWVGVAYLAQHVERHDATDGSCHLLLDAQYWPLDEWTVEIKH